MDPNIWGKHLWTSIHFIALGYPDYPTESEKQNYHKFFSTLPNVLPCKSCRDHLTETLQTQSPLHANFLKNKDELFKWTHNLHNIVNKRLNKVQLSLDKALSTYMKKDQFQNAMCPSTPVPTTTTLVDQEIPFLTNGTIMFILFITCLSVLLNAYNIFFPRRLKF
ncbi:putative FAD-linked sulfhydryl oxidase R596 [Pyramimonas orientalis virus]|uniref:Sulfhydryl oxidase n=1 Tax=Pyramimonas orientalis virus 01B TaxID=3134525 RepID=A0A7L9AYD7_9VIRU|nr:putative FAD-linked sulfhydryl oxidase R596 [Pyramimonas orientalis virus]QOI90180.1 putative FAD-linked sulfhydryl oxidase R596 [Pyramimonas orientalis virus]